VLANVQPLHHRKRLTLLVGGAGSLAAAVAMLAATSQTATRQALLTQLQRPARPAVSTAVSHPLREVVRAGRYRFALSVTPNHASTTNGLTVALTENHQPLAGAHVVVRFSMPAMDMPDAFTSALRAVGRGVYRVNEPVLGMAGWWKLRVSVSSRKTAPVSATFADQLIG